MPTRTWLRDRSVLFQLLAGGLSILAATSLLWTIAEVLSIRELDRTNVRRWAAMSVASQLDMARQYESVGDFAQQGEMARQFYERGETPALAQHRAAMAHVSAALDTLDTRTDEDQRDTERRLREMVATYAATFDTLTEVYRERGADDFGVAGAWRRAVTEVVARARAGGGVAVYDALQLMVAQHDMTTAPSELHAAAVEAASAATARSGHDVPGLAGALARSDSLFHAYQALSNHIGTTEAAGLHGVLLATATAVQNGVDGVLNDAIQDADDARTRLAVVTVVGLLGMLGLAGFFFYRFARPIAATTGQLATAATEIGHGNFDVRVEVSGKNELGQLAANFNAMAQQLSALITAVSRAGGQIDGSAAEIAATARQQQATASEIAATTSEVSSTAREISATSQELATNMRHVAAVAEQTAVVAAEGQTEIARMAATIRQITDASDSIGARLATLAEKAGNINTVVTTIAKVADQTNLLSLNAAIEAEKAGEAGRGFSVVAQEIRRLADQTAIATGDIEGIVKEIQSAVTAGVMGMDKFSDEIRRGVEASGQVGRQLTEILNQVQTLTPNFETVSHGMQSQAEAAQQISLALSQLGTAAQQTVESLVQSNRVIDQLNEAAASLQSGVARFKTAAA